MALTRIQVGETPKDKLTLVRLQGKKVSRSLPRWWDRICRLERRTYLRTHHWMDHIGRDGNVLIAEPYDVFTDDIQDLLYLCNKYDLHLIISAESQHFPTRTVSIRLEPRKAFVERMRLET